MRWRRCRFSPLAALPLLPRWRVCPTYIRFGSSTSRAIYRMLKRPREQELALTGSSASQRRKIFRAFGATGESHVDGWVRAPRELETYIPAQVNGQELKLNVYHPTRLVQYVLDNSPGLRDIYSQRLQVYPPPWHILAGFDEQTPGSKVNQDNKRKNMVFTFNFAELGSDVLQMDDTWFIPLVLRCDTCGTVDGAWSHVLAALLRMFLLEPLSLKVAGIIIQVGLSADCLRADLKKLLTDGEGWMKALEWNGHASLRPDFQIANMFKKGSGLADAARGFVDITCSDPTRLRRRTRSLLDEAVDAVADARRRYAARERGWTKERLERIIREAGFKPTPTGVLAQLRHQVDLLDKCNYDWMHSSLQHGWMSISMHILVDVVSRVKRGNPSQEDVRGHVKCYQFPVKYAHLGPACANLFSPKMVQKQLKSHHRVIVGNASVQLSLYPLLRDFGLIHARDTPELGEHVAVYLKACAVMDIIMLVKHRRLSTQDARGPLMAAYMEWFGAHKARYGSGRIVPKFGWMWSIIDRIAEDDWLFDMFVIERLHKRVKPHAELSKNLTNWEASVLKRVVRDQVTSLSEAANARELLARTYWIAGDSRRVTLECCTESVECGFAGVELHTDDIVVHEVDGTHGVIMACILYDDGRMAVRVEVMRRITSSQHGVSTWAQTPAQAIWHLRDVSPSLAWRPCPSREGTFVVIDYARPNEL